LDYPGFISQAHPAENETLQQQKEIALIQTTNTPMSARIPIATRPQSTQSTVVAMPRARVLIIDDDLYIREGMKALLECEDIDVITHDSMITLPLVLRASRPDVILLDIEMPALSGTAFFRLGRAEIFGLTNTSVILFSGIAETELADMAKGLGADGFIPKAGDPSRIVADVRKSIIRHRAQQALTS
jgi:FixJ family two-component response regulator